MTEPKDPASVEGSTPVASYVMRRYDSIIFDVDGTLLDPRAGFVASMRYAFDKIGAEYDPEYDRGFLIGPPIGEMLREILGDDAAANQALIHYREHFGETGYALYEVYSGIPELLSMLAADRDLYIATARSQRFSDLLLDHFDLSRHFVKMYGTGPNKLFYDKADLLKHIVAEHSLETLRTVMIGDRTYDVLAGRAAGMYTIGVSYGYGTIEELEAAGADEIVDKPEQLGQLL